MKIWLRAFVALNLLLTVVPAHAYVRGDRGTGAWVFVDFNDNRLRKEKNEVDVARARAGTNPFFVVESVADLERWLREHPQTPVGTLVLSGHSNGREFYADDVANLKALELLRLSRRAPQLKSVTGLYAWGCYTGVSSNFKSWIHALPHVAFVAGFDGVGPSGSPSAAVLDTVEAERVALEQSPDPEFVAKRLRAQPAFAITSGAIAVVSPFRRSFWFISNAEAHKERMRFSSKRECRARLAELAPIIAPDASITDFLVHYTLGGTIGSEGGQYHIERDVEGANPHSALRQVYMVLQRLMDCPDGFFTEPNTEKTLTSEGSNQILGLRDLFIYTIHSDEVLQNSAACAKDFLGAMERRLNRCGSPDFAKAHGLPSDGREALLQAMAQARRTDSRRDWVDFLNLTNPGILPASSEEVTRLKMLVMRMLSPAMLMLEEVPATFWLTPIKDASDARCKPFRESQKLAPLVEALSCEQSLDYAAFRKQNRPASGPGAADSPEAEAEAEGHAPTARPRIDIQ